MTDEKDIEVSGSAGEYWHAHFPVRIATGEIRKMARGINSITSEVLEYGAFCKRDIEALHLRICIINNEFQNIVKFLKLQDWEDVIDTIKEKDK